MFYVIEKRDSEWIVLAHGVAIMRCADADMALEIVQIAQEQLHRAGSGPAEVPCIRAPSVTPQQETAAPEQTPDLQHQITLGRNKPAKLP